MKEIKIFKKIDLVLIKKEIIAISTRLGYELINNGTQGSDTIVLSKKMSILSYGEQIRIGIKLEKKVYLVTIQSESKGIQLIDWGNNSENETKIALELTNQLK